MVDHDYIGNSTSLGSHDPRYIIGSESANSGTHENTAQGERIETSDVRRREKSSVRCGTGTDGVVHAVSRYIPSHSRSYADIVKSGISDGDDCVPLVRMSGKTQSRHSYSRFNSNSRICLIDLSLVILTKL